MIRTDKEITEAIERAVAAAERGTSAELVVVLASRSGPYLDVALAAGAVAAWLTVVLAMLVPATFPPLAVAAETVIVFAGVAWLTHRTPALLRVLVPGARAKRQVERAAAWWFLDEAVHGTRAHTGVLVYVSVLEQRAAIVPDLGLAAAVPPALWGTIRWGRDGRAEGPRTHEEVIDGIAAVGALLRERLPASGADVNELPDAPRIAP